MIDASRSNYTETHTAQEAVLAQKKPPHQLTSTVGGANHTTRYWRLGLGEAVNEAADAVTDR